MPQHSRIDPVTLEVIRNRLESIVREMGDITLRTARSAVVYAGRDFSCGVINHKAELLAVGTSVPVHIFPIVWQVKTTLERFKDDLNPGDIFIGNDPYDGGSHLNDVLIFIPVFHEGEVVAFAANRAHWYDIGGMVPGSLSGSASEIFQEGLRIPPIRLGQNNLLNRDILDMILRNVRIPEEVRGDILAQVASCRVASMHILGLIERYGKEVIMAHFDEVLDSSERRTRALIKELPDTTVMHEGYADNDGIETDHRRIQVTVTVDNDNIHVDYTGTAPQSKGPLNVGLSMAYCFAFMGVKAAIDPFGQINSGCFRPIQVTAPKGTMLNAEAPAPGGGMGEVGMAAVYTMAAMSKLAPDQVSAEEGAGANHNNLGGIDTRFGDPHRFIYYDYPAGGGGARSTKDGLDFVRPIRSGNVNIQSIEVLESLFPVFFHRHQLRTDSGGPGVFRGGMGVVREYHTASEGTYSVLTDHAIIPPAGIFGGNPGATGRWEVVRDDKIVPVSPLFGSKVTGFPIRSGDRIRMSSFGGGGYGDPFKRHYDHVLNDVLDGKVSLEQAESAYGVIINPDKMEIDIEETQELRSRLSEARIYLEPLRGQSPEFEGGMRLAWVNPSHQSQGICEGDMTELISSDYPSALRIRVRFSPKVVPSQILLDTEVWDNFRLSHETRLLWRPL